MKLILCTWLAALAAIATPTLTRADAPTTKRVAIAVTEDGFAPEKISVPAAKPVTLVITRKTDQTCAKRIVVELGDGKKVEKDLPLGKAIEIAATFAKAGELHYACGMNMLSGVIVVR